MEPTKALEELSESDPWDRRPGEPADWYGRFIMYRDLGPQRNLRRAYKVYRIEKNPAKPLLSYTCPPEQWKAHATQWEWKVRAEAWDKELYEVQAAEAIAELTSGYALAHMRVRALKKLAEKLETYLNDPHNNRLSPYIIEQYRGLMDDLAKEVGQRVKETRITGANGGNIVIETQWGRGGSATNAWVEAVEPIAIAEVKEASHEAVQEED